MKRSRFKSWIQNIIKTQDEEISCTECFTWVSHYVDVELAGKDVTELMPQVKLHLDQCAACREEYETLRDLQRLENEGGGLSTDDLLESIP